MPYGLNYNAVLLVFGAIVFFALRRKLRGKSKLPLPPGPRGWPLIGNLLQLPKEYEWTVFSEWAHRWGDVVYFSVLGQPIVVLNSARAVEALFDRPIYSGRPYLTMAGELVGFDRMLTFMQTGEVPRTQRRLVHRVLGSRANVEKHFGGILESELRKALLKLLDDPDNVEPHFRTFTGASVLKVTYGYEVQDQNGQDPLVVANEAMERCFERTAKAGAYLVDAFPILKYVPAWFPGAAFKREAEEMYDTVTDLIVKPFEHTKREMAAGTAPDSFTSFSLEDESQKVKDEQAVMIAASAFFLAGVDTTTSTIQHFILAMMLHPDAQRKAQAELDSLLGSGSEHARLPTLSDRECLPYVNAAIMEAFRWHPLLPIGVPHRVTEDDVYKGYYIPKDATVIMNTWQILHEPSTYKDPMRFRPERFVPAEGHEAERDPLSFAFGYGRRICPGRILADSTTFLACATLLALFDLLRPADSPLDVDTMDVAKDEFTGAVLSRAKPFKCDIKPRSEKVVALIQGSV